MNQTIEFEISSVFGAEIDPSTLMLNYRVEGESDFLTSPAFNFAPSTAFTASFGELPCNATAEYFISGQTLDGTDVTSPSNAPEQFFTAIVANNEETVFEDDAETDTGWIVGVPTDTATTGIWERVDPSARTPSPRTTRPTPARSPGSPVSTWKAAAPATTMSMAARPRSSRRASTRYPHRASRS